MYIPSTETVKPFGDFTSNRASGALNAARDVAISNMVATPSITTLDTLLEDLNIFLSFYKAQELYNCGNVTINIL